MFFLFKILPTVSWTPMLGPQLLVLFGKAAETLGGGALEQSSWAPRGGF